MPNLDCTSKEISIQSTIVPVRKSLVQWLTESRFGISKFGIPIEIRSLKINNQQRESLMYGIGCIDIQPKIIRIKLQTHLQGGGEKSTLYHKIKNGEAK